VSGQNSLNDLNIIFKHNFENNTLGNYSAGEWERDWLSPPWNNRQEENDIVINTSDLENPTKTMQVNFPANSLGPEEGGTQWVTPLPAGLNEMYCSYDLLYMPGFQFQLGGKLPSLMGGKAQTGVKPTGYEAFRAGLSFFKDGQVRFYMYYPDQATDMYGQSIIWGQNYSQTPCQPSKLQVDYTSGTVSNCKPGIWYNLTFRLVLNTVKSTGGGNYDGILEAYFNGKLVLQMSHLLFRHTNSLTIDGLLIYTFFGGNTDDFRNPISQWLRIDNMMLYTFNNNVDVPRGNTLSPLDRTIKYWRQLTGVNTQVPAMPGAMTISNHTKSAVTISWSDNSSNEKSFRIYRSLSSTEGFTEIGSVPANVTTFTDNTLQPEINYFYRLRSSNDAGYSNYTSALLVAPPQLSLPEAPTGLTSIQFSYTSAKVGWSDNSGNETGFEIERSGPDNFDIKKNFLVSANVTSFSDTGLLMNSNYQYKVRAFNGDGSSLYSGPIQIKTLALNLPSAPSQLKSTEFTEKSITVSWNDNSTNEDGFVITRSLALDASESVQIEVEANDTSFIDNYLLPSTSYVYTVEATNHAGNSKASNKNVAATLSLAETKRIREGLIAYYNFGYDPDYMVHDQSLYGEPLDLDINNPDAVAWQKSNKLDINSATVITSSVPATKLVQALKKTNEITLECWIKPFEPDLSSDSRIISLSNNNDEVGFVLDQDYLNSVNDQSLQYCTRIQTESTNSSGYPEFIPDISNNQSFNLQHLAYVRDSLGGETMYINGEKSSEGFRPSNFGTWSDDFYLRLGNESDLQHPWTGTFYSVAIYNKALSQNQVINNFSVGPCDSIKREGMKYQINVFPNPVTDIATVEITPVDFQDFVPRTSLRVLDVFGKVYYNKTLFNPNYRHIEPIDFKHFQKGVYLLQVISGNQQNSTKLIVR